MKAAYFVLLSLQAYERTLLYISSDGWIPASSIQFNTCRQLLHESSRVKAFNVGYMKTALNSAFKRLEGQLSVKTSGPQYLVVHMRLMVSLACKSNDRLSRFQTEKASGVAKLLCDIIKLIVVINKKLYLTKISRKAKRDDIQRKFWEMLSSTPLNCHTSSSGIQSIKGSKCQTIHIISADPHQVLAKADMLNCMYNCIGWQGSYPLKL